MTNPSEPTQTRDRKTLTYIGHKCIDHNYKGHNYIGHNYIGHYYIGRSAVSPLSEAWHAPHGHNYLDTITLQGITI